MSEPHTTAANPANHPGTASWLRRVGALFVDWLASYLVAFFILRDVQHPAFGALTLLVFLLQSAVGVALTGSSFGQTVAKIQVHHLDGRPLSLLRSLLRQLLVCLVIPPLVFRPDGRGLHDLATVSAAFPKARRSTMPSPSRRVLAAVLTAVVLLAPVAGCGGGNDR